MKAPIRWLQEYVPVSESASEIAEKLTMSGTEVGSIEVVGGTWEKITVGRIAEIQPHPDADRLQLVTIEYGSGTSTVVCGAFNIRVGDLVPFAQVGARLLDAHSGKMVQLKPARIRGVSSEGMACSEKELGLSESHEGVLVLPVDAPLGIPLADYLGDAILDLEITPNRPDCLSMIGIAREIAALTSQAVTLPSLDYQEEGPPIDEVVSVEIADADLCRRYCASLIHDVKIGPSPTWMQKRLISCGMRPINNIVDITNYVMLEFGQPLHAFDARQIGGNKIVVRRAGAGEKLISLDGVERALAPEMLVIADSRIPVAIAGVMGGADSEVIDITTSILLESANFNPTSIRRTSSALKLRSEASMRFERGISPELAEPALRRATQLIVHLAGGKAARHIIDVYPGKSEAKPVIFDTSWIKRLLGIDISRDHVVKTFTSLGFECRSLDSTRLEVVSPYWRMDIERSADLVEELARIDGYDRIPTTMLSTSLPQQHADLLLNLREDLRDLMVRIGFQEVVNYSLTTRERPVGMGEPQEVMRVANPLSSDQEYLRTSLRPGLLSLLANNQKHEEGSLRFFEIGRVFFPRDRDLPSEQEMLTAVLSGTRTDLSWRGDKEPLDFFDAKGIVEGVLTRLGIHAQFRPTTLPGLHPGRVAGVFVEEEAVGFVGEIHPSVAEGYDLLPQPVALFEVEIGKLLSFVSRQIRYQPISRFPKSVRDLALVVDENVPSGEIAGVISGFPLVNSLTLFDVYTGKQVPPGKKSLAYRIAYQSDTHTLTEEELVSVEKAILRRLSEGFGATLRG
jgi:phenylalanyl-tRNA synthetase beta chain